LEGKRILSRRLSEKIAYEVGGGAKGCRNGKMMKPIIIFTVDAPKRMLTKYPSVTTPWPSIAVILFTHLLISESTIDQGS